MEERAPDWERDGSELPRHGMDQDLTDRFGTGQATTGQSTDSARPDALLNAAASAGRTDVLGPAGLTTLQRTVGNEAVAQLVEDERDRGADETAGRRGSGQSVEQVVTSGGRPLPPHTRADMERRLGADFGDVRVHTDSGAHESAKALNAHAYTTGNSIVFQRDAYDPDGPAGRTTLAHELTHVLQQRNGPVDGTPTADGVSVSDPSDRFEQAATANAEAAMAEPVPAPVGNEPAVQRRTEGDDEEEGE